MFAAEALKLDEQSHKERIFEVRFGHHGEDKKVQAYMRKGIYNGSGKKHSGISAAEASKNWNGLANAMKMLK